MTLRTRFFSIATATVAFAAVALAGGATPASAFEVHTLAAIGSIDSITVDYGAGDPNPLLHIVGWAGDLNERINGDTDIAGLELYMPGPGGAHTTVAWAERGVWDKPRPDVPKVYPQLGPNQGFDMLVTPPTTGALTICLRLYNLDAYPESASPLSCATVTVPAHRPAFTLGVTGSGVVDSPLSLALSQASGGSDSYSWWNPDPHVDRALLSPIAGATAATFTPGPELIGHSIVGVVTTRGVGSVIVQTTAPITVTSTITDPPERVSSDDRYSTSVAASQKAFPDATAGVPVAYIASGVAFPDALSAGAAAAKLHGTLLLTPPTALDARVQAELVRLHPARIVVVGGPAAVSDAVVSGLRQLPITTTVQRIGGADRFAVSRAVVADAFGASVPNLYLVTGNAFPDALAAATAGAVTGRPVLLVNGWQATPDAATSAALRSWGTTHVTIVGGTTSVSTGIEHGLGAGVAVARAAGSDRFATAAALARTLPPTGTAYLASGYTFPDALTTAVLAGAHPAPLLLTRNTCTPSVGLSELISSGVSHLVLVGGPQVQSENVPDLAC